ncbi:MAG: Wzz/FepE/Etk N-terminal domain-containing protein [Thiogranum sp.]|nr:Wzz/FepE/Etk N-terminal domain-containing protein [Thiogranum sp.]
MDKSTAAAPMPVYIASSPLQEDEVSLSDLARIIVRRKWVVMGCLVICLLVAALYLYFADPVYKSAAHLLPPQQAAIQRLIVASNNFGIEKQTTDSVYMRFLENIRATGLRREFFDDAGLVDHYLSGVDSADVNIDGLFIERFNRNVTIDVDGKNPAFVTVGFADKDAEFSAEVANQLVDFVDKRTVAQLVNSVNTSLAAQMGILQRDIAIKRNMAETRKQDTITQLREARSIAEALGIVDSSAMPIVIDKLRKDVPVNTVQIPLYMRGVKALDIEIKALESRESADPFIEGLREHEEKLNRLKGLLVDAAGVSAVTLDMPARTPYRRDSPRYALVLALAVSAGILLGLVMVFAAEALVGKGMYDSSGEYGR